MGISSRATVCDQMFSEISVRVTGWLYSQPVSYTGTNIDETTIDNAA